MKKSDKPVIVEQEFNTSIEDLWTAITHPDHMREWFFENIPAFEAKEGFSTHFNVQTQDRDFLHLWEITELIPGKKIRYNWKYGGYPGDSFVTFELFEREDKTLLRLTHDVTEDFPEDIPEFSRESCLNGWNYFIKESLDSYMKEL